VYGKGPYFYDAVRRAIGDGPFFTALGEYVQTYRFRMAPPRGLVQLLARGRHRARVQALARRWLEEAHGDADLGGGGGRGVAAALLGVGEDEVPPEVGALIDSLGSALLGGGAGGGGRGGSGLGVDGLGGDRLGGGGPGGIDPHVLEGALRMLEELP
jgi:hypothetical protein